jgi:NADH:ubiquinone reductase (H+-translocating)
MTPAPNAEGAGVDGVSVLVIGAGYAGVMATNRLLSSLSRPEATRVRVTVVNPRPDFVERIRLHELAAGTRASVLLPLADTLHREARLLVGTARRIDPDARTVSVATAAGDVTERYDLLVYAPGSAAAAPIPGAREHAHLLADLEGARTAADRLAGSAAGSRVVVVGGGLTGVEAAAEIAGRRPGLDVTLLSSGPVVTQMPPHARRTVRRALTRLGVHLVEDATAERITSRAAVLSDGRTVVFDTCLVAVSFTAPDLARASGLGVDDVGRLRVDETLRCPDAPTIVGAGDAIVTPRSVGAHLRMSCAAALPLGGHAAETVLHLIRRDEPAPISIGFVLQCVSLGRKDGYIQLVRPDDTARAGRLTGRGAAWVKERICRLVVDGPRNERHRPGAYRAPKGPQRVALDRLTPTAGPPPAPNLTRQTAPPTTPTASLVPDVRRRSAP